MGVRVFRELSLEALEKRLATTPRWWGNNDGYITYKGCYLDEKCVVELIERLNELGLELKAKTVKLFGRLPREKQK